MFSAHTQIREALALIIQLHTAGHRTARFMLLSGNNGQSIFVGPRKLFSLEDGLYIPTDLRHRAVQLNLGEPMPDSTELFELLCIKLASGTTDIPNLGLDGEDEPYEGWIRSLIKFLHQYDLALPRREMHEFLNKNHQALKIEFRETFQSSSLAPAISFKAPPGGVLISSLDHSNSKPSLAQPRPSDSPNLLWKIDRGLSESEIDYLS